MLRELGRWDRCFGGSNQLGTELGFSICVVEKVQFRGTHSVCPETLKWINHDIYLEFQVAQELKLTIYDSFKCGL